MAENIAIPMAMEDLKPVKDTQIETILSELDGSSDSFIKLANKLTHFKSDDNSFLMQLSKVLKDKFPPMLYKNRAGYTKVLLELANAQGKVSPEAARTTFQLIKTISNKLAIAYISWAQFELAHKNLPKAMKLLKNAKQKNAEPKWLLDKAFTNMVAGKINLLDTVIDPWENVNTNIISTSPPSSSSVSAHTTIIPAAASVVPLESSCKDPESPHGGTVPLPTNESLDLSWMTSGYVNRKNWNLGMPVRFKQPKLDNDRSAKRLEESFNLSLEIKRLPFTPISRRRGDLSMSLSTTLDCKPLDISQSQEISSIPLCQPKCPQLPEFDNGSKFDNTPNRSFEIKSLFTNRNDESVNENKYNTDEIEKMRKPSQPSAEIVRPSANTDLPHNTLSSAAPSKVQLNSNNPFISDHRDPKYDLLRHDSGSYDNQKNSPQTDEFSWDDKQRTNSDSGFQDQGSPSKGQGSPLKEHGSPLKDHGSPLKVQGSPLKVQGLPLKVQVSPFKVPNLLPPRPMQKSVQFSNTQLSYTQKDSITPLLGLDILKEKNIINPSTPNGLQKIMQNFQVASTTNKGKLLRIKRNHYKVISIVGRGGSSKVYEVENENRERFAVKRVQLDDVDDPIMQSYINEINFLLKLKGNPFIIELYDWEVRNEILYMLMERGDLDLAKYFKTHQGCSNDVLRTYWKQMLCAVDAIHTAGIIHMDLKPANFLFVNNNIKLIDFGIANAVQVNKTSVTRECQIGTLNYMAPESMTDTSYERDEQDGKPKLRIRRATDVWSLGCILYYMVYGRTPYQHISNQTLKIEAIKCGQTIDFRFIENEHLLDSMKGCLRHNPRSRYTIDQLLSHPFLTKGTSPENNQCNTSADQTDPVPFHDKENLHRFAAKFAEAAVNSPKSIKRIRRIEIV